MSEPAPRASAELVRRSPSRASSASASSAGRSSTSIDRAGPTSSGVSSTKVGTTSTGSSGPPSRRNTTMAVRKQSVHHARSSITDFEDKSLTSFPSLSPEASPHATKHALPLGPDTTCDISSSSSTVSHPRGVANGPQSQLKHGSAISQVVSGHTVESPAVTPTKDEEQERVTTPLTARRYKPTHMDALTKRSTSVRGGGGPPLFDESPTTRTGPVGGAPSTLHEADDDALRGLIARTGAVRLVRQLAQDLALREAEATKARRRAEARERELKKMLREVEVSNLDIERRLHRLEIAGYSARDGTGAELKRGTSEAEAGLGKLMQEALRDELGSPEDQDFGYLDASTGDKEATIKARQANSAAKGGNDNSKSSGWRGILWNGTSGRRRSRANSTADSATEDDALGHGQARAGSSRKGVDGGAFTPMSTNDDQGSESTSVKSKDKRAPSLSSWTMSLFGGKAQPNKNDSQPPSLRGRSEQTSQTSTRDVSQASSKTTSSAQAALLRVKASNPSMRSESRRNAPPPLSAAQLGTARSAASQVAQNLPPTSPASVSTNGPPPPVEMDAILPAGTRPPTLSPPARNADDSGELLTDRFGFIYDQRRRKKEAEAFARMGSASLRSKQELLSTSRDSGEAESFLDASLGVARPGSPASISSGKPDNRRWQDYFKIATFPTELLAHTPAPGAGIMTLGNPEIKNSLRRSSTLEDIAAASPPKSALNPLPSASTVTSDHAEFASPTTTTATAVGMTAAPTTATVSGTADAEPVRLLLAQLTDLHDSLQREKEVRWNEFLRKVRAERQRAAVAAAGEAAAETGVAADTPEASLLDGEIVGLSAVGNTGKTGRAKYKEFRQLVLGGIPVSLRAKIWAECSGASAMRVPGSYTDLASGSVDGKPDDPAVVAQIDMDIGRTLTDNVFFRRGPGVAKLKEVLRAYARRNPEVGYCQGMNLIAASLLLIMPTSEDAFWVLCSVVETILPSRYYDSSLLASRADQAVLRGYVGELLPKLGAHLDALIVELEALTFQWFLSLFTDVLSAEALFRVWDVLLCIKDDEANGGSTFLFQVALALLKLNEPQLLACDSPSSLYAYLGASITNHAISIDALIAASDSLRAHVRRADVEERRARQIAKEEEMLRERERIRREVGGGSASSSVAGSLGDAKRDADVPAFEASADGQTPRAVTVSPGSGESGDSL